MPKVTVAGHDVNVSRHAARTLESLGEAQQATAAVSGWSKPDDGALFLLTPTEFLRIARDIDRVPIAAIERYAVTGNKLRLRAGEVFDLDASDAESLAAFARALRSVTGLDEWTPPQRTSAPRVNTDRITTMDHLPGYTVVRALGPVSVLSSASGFTAKTKGNTALERATSELIGAASELGANAVIGLTASAFGAGGGITNALGGDAVGVLLIGTAVVVEEDPKVPEPGMNVHE